MLQLHAVANQHEGKHRGRRIFWFEEVWTRSDECKTIISESGGWHTQNAMKPRLELCLQRCKTHLQKWGKGTYPLLRKEILKLQESLQIMYKKPIPWDFNVIREIEAQLDKALEEEEIY